MSYGGGTVINMGKSDFLEGALAKGQKSPRICRTVWASAGQEVKGLVAAFPWELDSRETPPARLSGEAHLAFLYGSLTPSSLLPTLPPCSQQLTRSYPWPRRKNHPIAAASSSSH